MTEMRSRQHGRTRSLTKRRIKMKTRRVTGWLSAFIPLLMLGAGAADIARGASLSVTNDGSDSPSCGAASAPCRSISQAIENASNGDSIFVGAGQYGDLTGNGSFTGPGDERPGPMPVGISTGCVICITKAVRIYSLHGAAVTVIHAPPQPNWYNAVIGIVHDGVTFGAVNEGFTITGGNRFGVLAAGQCDVGAQTGWVTKVSVLGNVDVEDNIGFAFLGQLGPAACPEPAPVLLASNTAVDNSGGGFQVEVNNHRGPVHMQENKALRCGVGFSVDPGSLNEDIGFAADNVQLSGNVATHCNYGFVTSRAGNIQFNTAAGNRTAGFWVTPMVGESAVGQGFGPVPPPKVVFTGNSAIGNGGPGAVIVYEPDNEGFSVPPTFAGFASFSRNNFYGNDRSRPAGLTIGEVGFKLGAGARCGVLNAGSFSSFASGDFPLGHAVNLRATDNFWGSSSGPQAGGVGDNAGGACDKNGGVTSFKPVATTPFGITSLP